MLYEFEIVYAAEAVVSRLLGVQAGEVIVITLDTASDHRVATAFGSAVHMHDCLKVGVQNFYMERSIFTFTRDHI
ncbi:MAG: hypothetical protein QXT77_05265 [Candidatus Methanomethylicaceae archaeon]